MKKTKELPTLGGLVRTPVNAIMGPHPRLKSIIEQHDLSPSQVFSSGVLTERVLLALLELNPPHVMKMRDGLRYLSGLPLLTEAKRLDRNIEIPVLLHSGREPIQKILFRALGEVLFQPLLYRPGKDLVADFLRVTNLLADQDEYGEVSTQLGLNDKNHLARLLHVSPKTLNRHGA